MAETSKGKKDIAASLFTKYETIDFEEPDHAVLRLHYGNKTSFTKIREQLAHYALSLLMVAVISGLFLGLTYSTEILSEKRLERIRELVESNERGTATLFATGTAVAATILPSLLVVFVAPSAIGSGMTDVIALLNGASSIDGMTLTVLAVKYVSIIGLVCAGLFSGVDGPMSQIGAGVAMVLVQGMLKWTWFRRAFLGETLDLGVVNDKGDLPVALQSNRGSTTPLDNELGDDRETDLQEQELADSLLGFLQNNQIRLFATLGAATSIAVIFRAPIGGVLFAVEEATSFFELSLLIQLIFATICGFLIVAFTTFGIQERLPLKNIFLDPLEAALFPTESTCKQELRWSMLFTYILIGIVAALFGQLLNKTLSFVQKTRSKYLIDPETNFNNIAEKHHEKTGNHVPAKPFNKKLNSFLRVLEVAVVAVVTALIVVWLPSDETIDTCVSLKTPLAHVSAIRPECDFNKLDVTCATLSACKSVLDESGICFPTDYEHKFVQSVTQAYQVACGAQVASTATEGSHSKARRAGEEKGHEEGASAETHSTGSDASHSTGSDTSHSTGSDNSTAHGSSSASPAEKFALYFNPHGGSELGEQMILSHDGKCYYQVRSLFWTSPERQLEMLLKRGMYNLWDAKSMGIFFVIYLMLSVATYYIALPTDLVVPNLIIGAAAGRMLGLLVNTIQPGHVDPGAYALMGMAALWSGTSGLVLTVIAVALEMTGDFSALPALIIVTITSAGVSSTLGPSLYHSEMENNGAPYLPAEPNQLLRCITTKEIMHKEIVVVGRIETLADVKKVLRTFKYRGFPVVDTHFGESGIEISHKVLRGAHHDSSDNIVQNHRPIGYVTRNRLNELVRDMERSQYPETATFDIESIIASSPMCVREDSTASKVYTLFRKVGLKRMFVVSQEGFLTGLVVRRDLIRPVLEAEENEKPARNLRELARSIKRHRQQT
ncbi:hypothetical protein HDU77_002697 [Chytriomyces hyalinus]|nr:hypothetical protein HDU77_002697 [Chytriomyces hyalinus]